MAIRRTDTQPPDLSPQTCAVLLHGWLGQPPASESAWHGFSGGFMDLYEIHNRGAIRLWRTHEHYLRSVAEAWGWTPMVAGPDGRVYFWAEALSLGVEERNLWSQGSPGLEDP